MKSSNAAKAGIHVNLDKNNLYAKIIGFLGLKLIQAGHWLICKHNKAILKITTPYSIKKIVGFLGPINFIKNHIPNCAGVLQPITKLTKKDLPYIRGEQQATVFYKDQGSHLECNPLHISQP